MSTEETRQSTPVNAVVMQRFWVSWVQPGEDHRPLGYPPNDQILGWWCSGYDSEDNAMLCACVVGEGETVGDQMRHATAAIEKEWPEATAAEQNENGWRFFEQREANWQPNDRFPLSDWMGERFNGKSA